MPKSNKNQEVLDMAYEALICELKKDPLSPVRVAALTEMIKVLSGVNPLSQF